MEIYPEDLGPRQCRQVLEHRLWCVGTDGASWAAAPIALPFGRVQIVPKRKTAPVWQYLVGSAFGAWLVEGMFHFSFWPTLLFCAAIAIVWRHSRGGQAPSAQQGSAEPQTGTYAHLTEPEVALLQNNLLQRGSDDSVLELYLDLVWAAMNLAPLATGQADTERSTREAIRALGGAIETLPPQTLDGVPDSYTKLEAVAARLASEATGETDPVVAASLGRRAEALRGQAETAAHVRVLLRRNAALREELADQIGALRTSLAAVALGGNDSGPELAGLAARIRRVASEANAVTAAHVEVDTLLSQPVARAAVPLTEERPPQRLGLNGEPL